jgi:hypothetical protein
VFCTNPSGINPKRSRDMVTQQTTRYANKNVNLDQLSEQVVGYLNQKGFATQKAKSEKGIVIEARKENLLRDLITADRALTILIQGQPNDFSVTVGIGRWVQNLTVTVVEAAITAGLFLIVDIPEMAWNHHIRDEIVAAISQMVEGKQVAQVTQ